MILRRVAKMSEHTCGFSVSSELKPTQDTGYEFKHDYTIIESPRAVAFPVDNNDRKIMRFNEIYKFSDGTLTNNSGSAGLQCKGIQGQAAQSGSLRVLRIILVVLPEHRSDTKVLTMKIEILLKPTSNKLLVVGFNSLVHSLRALSTLRRSGFVKASAAAKPCQGDSSDIYLITGNPEKCEHAGPMVTTLHGGNITTRMIKRFTVADDLKESSKITQVKGTKFKDHYIMYKESCMKKFKDYELEHKIKIVELIYMFLDLPNPLVIRMCYDFQYPTPVDPEVILEKTVTPSLQPLPIITVDLHLTKEMMMRMMVLLIVGN
ncbi:hypothetical protein Tco_0542155 [Tanacetum coccineum]